MRCLLLASFKITDLRMARNRVVSSCIMSWQKYGSFVRYGFAFWGSGIVGMLIFGLTCTSLRKDWSTVLGYVAGMSLFVPTFFKMQSLETHLGWHVWGRKTSSGLALLGLFRLCQIITESDRCGLGVFLIVLHIINCLSFSVGKLEYTYRFLLILVFGFGGILFSISMLFVCIASYKVLFDRPCGWEIFDIPVILSIVFFAILYVFFLCKGAVKLWKHSWRLAAAKFAMDLVVVVSLLKLIGVKYLN